MTKHTKYLPHFYPLIETIIALFSDNFRTINDIQSIRQQEGDKLAQACHHCNQL